MGVGLIIPTAEAATTSRPSQRVLLTTPAAASSRRAVGGATSTIMSLATLGPLAPVAPLVTEVASRTSRTETRTSGAPAALLQDEPVDGALTPLTRPTVSVRIWTYASPA